MKIREVCTRTGLTDKAIRFYIEKGLLKKAAENINGRNCRDYEEEDVQQLKRIAALRKAGFSIQDILKMQQAPQMVQDVMDTHSKKLEADAEAYIAISKKLKSIHVGGGISWQKLADVLMADGENVWNNAELQWPEEMLQVEGGQVMEMREQKDNNVEKRSLMYSQMFNYNLNQASMAGSRNIEVSAAVEGGGKSIASKRNRNIGLVAIVTLLACIFGWSFAHEDIAVTVSDFMLEKNGVEMQLAEPDMVTLNMAAIFREENENYASTYNGESERYYSQRYNFWSEVPLSDGMKDHVAEDEEIRFSLYEMRIYEKDKLGRLNVRVIDEGALNGALTHVQYELNGIFKIADYTQADIVLADKGDLATFVHESESGNKAYFVRNWMQGTYTVYFVVDDILFEMEISSAKKSVESAKKIFEAMAD